MARAKALTYYDILQISPRATDADVRQAWRALARRCHPDLHPNNPQLAKQLFQTGYQAYTHLRTTAQRQAYNRHLLGLIARQRAARNAGVMTRATSNTNRPPARIRFWPFSAMKGSVNV